MDALDPEIQAMANASAAISTLDEDTRVRVLKWLVAKYVPSATTDTIQKTPQILPPGAREVPEDEERIDDEIEYDEFAELYAAIKPPDLGERVLAAAYWTQVISDAPSWGSASLNKILKDTGYGVTHINRVLVNLLKDTPALVIQLKRGGNTQQSRKTFKLTSEGIKFVAAKLHK